MLDFVTIYFIKLLQVWLFVFSTFFSGEGFPEDSPEDHSLSLLSFPAFFIIEQDLLKGHSVKKLLGGGPGVHAAQLREDVPER